MKAWCQVFPLAFRKILLGHDYLTRSNPRFPWCKMLDLDLP